MFFFLSSLGEGRYALEVTYDSGKIVEVIASAYRTLLKTVLTDKTAVITYGVGYIDGKIGTLFCNGPVHDHTILRFGEMLIEINMESRATVKILGHLFAVQVDLIEHGKLFIFNAIEIRIIDVARNEVAVFSVPLGVLYTEVLRHSVTFMTSEVMQFILFYFAGGGGSSKRVFTLDLLSLCHHRVQTVAYPYGSLSFSRSRCNYACALLSAKAEFQVN